jgi:thiamine biosynthesis lipoprotein
VPGRPGRPGHRSTRRSPGPWRPRFRGGRRPELLLGDAPVDLGGIGKGLAVRWAAERLADVTPSYLVEAGGDCYCAGTTPEGARWFVGVEDPAGGSGPVAVLALSDLGCATSSIRLRRWSVGGAEVHHLVDPRTGRPGGRGLAAVTVVGPDTADAEVWSKSLFLSGSDGIRAAADARGLAALWVGRDGDVGLSRAMGRHLVWRAA